MPGFEPRTVAGLKRELTAWVWAKMVRLLSVETTSYTPFRLSALAMISSASELLIPSSGVSRYAAPLTDGQIASGRTRYVLDIGVPILRQSCFHPMPGVR